jgi:hypothetical protein
LLVAAAAVLIVVAATVLAAQSAAVRDSVLFPLRGVLGARFSTEGPHTDTVAALVVSHPAGAKIVVDNRELGQTPARVNVERSALLRLHMDGFVDDFVRADAPTADVQLWRAQPDVQVIRPPTPGAIIRSANFLPDGHVLLDIEIPPGAELQAWAYNATLAQMARLGQADAPGGVVPGVVALAPDGTRTASILRLDGLDGAVADQLELDGPEGRHRPLADTALGERLLDLTWSPSSTGLVLVSERRMAGRASFHLRFVADSQVRDLADLPEEPVSGSWVWSPDGQAAAFLVGPKMALATLDLVTGNLRYLGDLQAGAFPGSGAVAPATWSLSGKLLYAGPSVAASGGSSSSSASALFEVNPGRLDVRRLGDVEPVWAPIVRDDGIILTLARGANDELVLRPVDQAGHVLDEQRLGVPVSGPFAARWDVARRQLLIIRGAVSGGIDLLLLRFGSDDSHNAYAAFVAGNTTGASR